MELAKIAEEVKKLATRPRKRFFSSLSTLIELVRSALVLRGPYRLVLDSNIIMRLESYNSGKISEDLLSILLGFNFIKRLPFHIDVVVRPSVFYEFLWLKNVSSNRNHWVQLKQLLSIVEPEINGALLFDGIETYEIAENLGNLIAKDAEKIKNTLASYATKNWHFDFIRKPNGFRGILLPSGLIEVPPFLAAEGLYSEIGLEYFNERIASRFFIDHIEKYICECTSNNPKIIEKYSSKNRFSLTTVLKLSSQGKLRFFRELVEVQVAYRYSPALLK